MSAELQAGGEAKRVLSRWDLIAIGIGAVIGWSWILYAGIWSSLPGSIGGVIGWIIIGLLCTFVGVVYAELSSAFPRAGGEVVFAFEAIGEKAMIAASWCVLALWVGLLCFETITFPIILEGLGFPIPHVGKLYTLAGGSVFISTFLISIVVNAIFAYLNYRGIRPAAILQTIVVACMFIGAVFFFISSLFRGSPANAKPLFTSATGFFTILLLLPGFMSGFNAIPQAAEEAYVEPNILGKSVTATVWGSVLFYVLIVIGLSLAAPLSVRSGEGLVVVKAVDLMYHGSPIARYIVLVASLLGMLTTWNACYIAGSRLMFALGRAKVLPTSLGVLHPKYGVPHRVILVLFGVSSLSCLLGTSESIYVGIVDVFSFFLVIAWLLTSISFIRLRSMRPDLERPYKAPAGKAIGYVAAIFSAAYLLVYTPLTPSGLKAGEWIAVGVIVLVAVLVYFLWNTKSGYLPPEERKRLLRGE
ncbi:MAG: APC family permease [Actinomycetota bacterium]|nr:APC family permease [Actinomycetota bacterium]